MRRLRNDLVNHESSEKYVNIVVAMNAVAVGLECNRWYRWKEHGERDHSREFVRVEYVFLLIYTVEFGLRLFALRMDVMQSSWIKFDGFLVVVGI